jgi:hypothetical protein
LLSPRARPARFASQPWPQGSKIKEPDETVDRNPCKGVVLIKQVAFAFVQFVLFLLAALAGIVLATFQTLPSHITKLADGTRGFQWDGIVLMTIVLGVILLIELVRKQIGKSGPWTVLAFVLALALAAKFSFLDLT